MSKSKKEKQAKGKVEDEAKIGDSSLSSHDQKGPKKLYCRVVPQLHPTKSIAPNIDNIVPINYDINPIIINSEHFTGYACFRVVNFDGHNPIDVKTGNPLPLITGSSYFNGHRRTFSLQLCGRFRKEWSADEVMFGTFFEKPIKLPPGHKIALALAKKIDASMDGDLGLDTPYMCSPLICAMNIARSEPIILSSLSENRSEDGSVTEAAFSHDVENTKINEPLYLPNWKYSEGKHLEENFMETVASWPESKLHHSHAIDEDDSDPLKEEKKKKPVEPKRSGSLMGFFSRTSSTSELVKKEPAAVTPSQRRSWFLNPDHRKSYKFRPDTLYSFDFNNQYVDLTKMQLKLGITFDVSYYLNDQPVRYKMRSRDGSVIFFTIELGLA